MSVLGLVCGLTAILGAGPAQADVFTQVPLGRASDVLVDPAASTVFVSGATNTFIDDGSTGGVVALHLDGSLARKITTGVDTDGMTLGGDGRVYAAEDPAGSDGDIVAIDPTGVAATVRYPLSGVDCPHSLAAVGSTIWFSYGCSPSSSAIGELDTTTSAVTTGLLAGSRSAVSLLAALPNDTNDLLVSDAVAGGSTPDLSVVSIASATPSVTTSVGVAVADLAVLPDGSGVVVGTSSAVQGYTLPGLTTSAGQTFATPNQYGASAVAVSPDGHYVASATGTDVSFNDTLTTYGPDSTQAIRTYDTSTPGSANPGQANNPVAGALGWSPTHVLYAVYADYGNGYPTVHVLTSAIARVTTMTLGGVGKAARGSRVELSGVFRSGGTVLADARLTVVRHDLAGKHVLASVTTNASGKYVVTDRPPIGGLNNYTVSYAGNAAHTAINRTHSVEVSRATPGLSLTLQHGGVYYNQKAVMRIHLGRTFNSRTVELFAQTAGKPMHHVLTRRVDSAGDVVAKIAMSQNTKFTAEFAGDYRYLPKSVSVTEYSGYRPSLRIGGGYATSGKYRLYRSNTAVKLLGKLLPAKAGRCLQFQSFHRHAGKWVYDGASTCFSTNRTGHDRAYFHPPHPLLGVPYAIRSLYAGDATHTWSVSASRYVEFTAATAARSRAVLGTRWEHRLTGGRITGRPTARGHLG